MKTLITTTALAVILSLAACKPASETKKTSAPDASASEAAATKETTASSGTKTQTGQAEKQTEETSAPPAEMDENAKIDEWFEANFRKGVSAYPEFMLSLIHI